MLKSRVIALKRKKLSPLIGCYRYQMSGSERERREADRLDNVEEEKGGFFSRLVPKNFIGIENVARLHSISYGDFTFPSIFENIQKRLTKAVEDNQKFIPERHKILGSNLACAHFVVARGGAIRFKGQTKWVKLEKKQYDLPRNFVPDLTLEAIDTTGMSLMYEGFENFTNLTDLKLLKLGDNPYIDDWCLDRLNIFKETLEELEIDRCPNVTERGLAVLHRLRKLKRLKLGELKGVAHLELTALMLEDYLKDCSVEGVTFDKMEEKIN